MTELSKITPTIFLRIETRWAQVDPTTSRMATFTRKKKYRICRCRNSSHLCSGSVHSLLLNLVVRNSWGCYADSKDSGLHSSPYGLRQRLRNRKHYCADSVHCGVEPRWSLSRQIALVMWTVIIAPRSCINFLWNFHDDYASITLLHQESCGHFFF